MTVDAYIARVLDRLPRTFARREQIAAELRGHIDSRVAAGQPVESVLADLGDPVALADSYVRETPLRPAPLGLRVGAKLVDILLAGIAAVVIWIVIFGVARMFTSDPERLRMAAVFGVPSAILLGTLLFAIYTIVAEWRFGQTIGKRLFGLVVVRESGGRIGFGQAVVRQLPAAMQFYWVDVLFAFFTERRQRAFELLSKTRVVMQCG